MPTARISTGLLLAALLIASACPALGAERAWYGWTSQDLGVSLGVTDEGSGPTSVAWWHFELRVKCPKSKRSPVIGVTIIPDPPLPVVDGKFNSKVIWFDGMLDWAGEFVAPDRVEGIASAVFAALMPSGRGVEKCKTGPITWSANPYEEARSEGARAPDFEIEIRIGENGKPQVRTRSRQP